MSAETRLDDYQELDYFEESLSSIFDDIVVSHGSPGEHVTHETQNYGTFKLRLTQPSTWEEQLCFSHFLWNSELRLAKWIDEGKVPVRGRRILVLGAGAGLCGILAVRAGAKAVVLSDYPAQSMLDNLRQNVEQNLTLEEQQRTNIVGHLWGEDASPLLQAGAGGKFDAVFLADCLWMPEQHDALIKTLVSVLVHTKEARIYCIAGFHSGRQKMANFFPRAELMGLTFVSEPYEISQRDRVRPWDPARPEEDSVERKHWTVIADLGHKS